MGSSQTKHKKTSVFFFLVFCLETICKACLETLFGQLVWKELHYHLIILNAVSLSKTNSCISCMCDENKLFTPTHENPAHISSNPELIIISPIRYPPVKLRISDPLQ